MARQRRLEEDYFKTTAMKAKGGKQLSVESAENDGKTDGSKQPPLPSPNGSSIPGTILHYQADIQGLLHNLNEAWNKSANKIEGDIAKLRRWRKGKMHDASGEAKQDLEGIGTHLPFWLYLVITLIIAASEYVFNSVVMQVFGEGQTATLLTALGIAVVIPVAAHAVGQFYKNRENLPLMMVVIIVVFALFIVIAVLRGVFLEEQGLVAEFTLPGWAWQLVFFVVNTVLFVVASVVAAMAPSFLDLLDQREERLIQEWQSIWAEAHSTGWGYIRFFESLVGAYIKGNEGARWETDQYTPKIDLDECGPKLPPELESEPDLDARIAGGGGSVA